MATDIPLTSRFNKQEPIPGYITKDLLGAGGNGEVWKCQAPGGLFKAVKFIHAGAQSKQASGELRSLTRIKEVRHPFLLSIERIEEIDGTVVVVTELADQSLKRHFQRQRAKGLQGIARDELIGYLRDAAEALDYIYDNYSLQHLDIKPENLLLVGNRAKVADFGLVRHLYDRSATRVEGLTPIYAPPELFEGKPNRHSDQYSLAIVFAEMLTGELPFDGTSAAQLAAQHLHMPPALSALPKGDQPVVARALSKDPSQRFPNCRTLIETLREASKVKDASSNDSLRNRARNQRQTAEASHTQDLPDGFVAGEAPPPAKFDEPCDRLRLPEIDMDEDVPMQYEPVLFIGIGGTATRVLRRLRRRIHDRLGPLETLPALAMLLIDTDVKGLNRATDGEHGAALGGDERLPTPLRRSEEYRGSAGSILSSISRRWLFNVPYSLSTEGFRPLGRLALLDHSKRVLERVQDSLVSITCDESTARTTETTGLQFASRQPRVFIIASTAGGTGSGMVLDVAYAVRAVLGKLDLPDGNVCGMLMHSTPCGPRDQDKAIANTYATLSELWHYSRPGKCYPGDRSCGLPAFHGNNRTFANCYFVHLGDGVSDLQLDLASDPVAEYLYSAAITPAARFFDKARQLENSHWGTQLTEPLVRTFGLCQMGGSNSEIPTILAEVLCRDLVCNWRGGIHTDASRTAPMLALAPDMSSHETSARSLGLSDIDDKANEKAVDVGINLDQMRRTAREILDHELSTDVESYFSALIARLQSQDKGAENSQIISAIDSALGGDEATAHKSLSAVLNIRLEALATQFATAVCDWVFDLLDSPSGVAGAQHAAEWFHNYLRSLQTGMSDDIGRLRESAYTSQHAILRADSDKPTSNLKLWPRRKASADIGASMRDYARAQIEQAIGCSVVYWLRLIEAQVNAELARLQTFWKDLNALAGKFDVSQSLDEAFEVCGGCDGVPNQWRQLLGELFNRRNDLVAALNSDITNSLAVGPNKLRWFLTQAKPVDTELVSPLRTAARRLILNELQNLNGSRLREKSEGPIDVSDFRNCVDAAQPRWSEEAAGTRLLFIVPKNVDPAAVRRMAGQEAEQHAAIICSTDGDFIACREAELLQVRRVAARLIDSRKDFVEIAQRLHTRIDVNWDDMSLSTKRQLVPGSACVPPESFPLSEVAQ